METTETIAIVVNGESRQVPSGASLARLLELLGLDHRAAHRGAGLSEKMLRRSRCNGVSGRLREEPFPKWRSR